MRASEAGRNGLSAVLGEAGAAGGLEELLLGYSALAAPAWRALAAAAAAGTYRPPPPPPAPLLLPFPPASLAAAAAAAATTTTTTTQPSHGLPPPLPGHRRAGLWSRRARVLCGAMTAGRRGGGGQAAAEVGPGRVQRRNALVRDSERRRGRRRARRGGTGRSSCVMKDTELEKL